MVGLCVDIPDIVLSGQVNSMLNQSIADINAVTRNVFMAKKNYEFTFVLFVFLETSNSSDAT